MGDEVVRAGGGVVWRRRGPDVPIEVLLVHRDRYQDWTFPKGKLDRGETWEQAARREVLEETGVDAVVGAELASTDYVDNRGRPKRVRYWSMTVDNAETFTPNDEVSACRWMTVEAARATLTYPRDQPVLESFRSTRS